MSNTLIQIISEETMPNLLAAMALKPKKIIHLCTSSMKRPSCALARAYKQSSINPDVKEVALSDNPGMVEMNRVVADVMKTEGDSVLNFTGGTKLMSIGAYAAASTEKICSVYVDTAAGEFVDGLTGGNFADLFPDGNKIERVSRQLTVNGIAVANGVERVSGGKKWKGYVELADILLRNQSCERKCHDIFDESMKKEPRGNFAAIQEWFKRKYEACITLPEAVSDAAVSAGLFRYDGTCVRPDERWLEKLLSFDFTKKYPMPLIYEAINDARWPFSFFNGNWWEVAVMRYLADSGRYRDLRWSVDAGSRAASSTDMEEDILGVDGVNLLYVSCKRGGDKAKLSRVLEDVNSSGRRLGGKFARKTLAIYIDPVGKQGERLKNRCKELKIGLLDRKTVASVAPLSGG